MENVMYAMGMLNASHVKSRCRFFFGSMGKKRTLSCHHKSRKERNNKLISTQLPAGRQLDGGMALRAKALRVGVTG